MADLLEQLKAALADRYIIERELGSGGMATVYLAEDLKLHRKVAVKVLRPELAAALGPDRFLQEIDIAAKLTHPHILGLHDCGEADGFLFYVMPHIEGESLRDKLAHEGELPIADAVRILRDVVDALTEAHEHGVVHRDIKPDNILLTKHHAVVTDFGVAKAVSDATGAQKLTTEGVALGTPAYMSPEQAVADSHIDHRADIYAVGAVAYELLTGRTPFVGTTQQEVLSAHVTQTPDPVTKHRDTVPPALAQLVMKCLEKKAADRWQTAEELLLQLEAWATPSGGVTPTGTMPVDRVVKHRWMMAGGAVAVAAIIAVIAIVAALPGGSDAALDPNHVVVGMLRNATGDPALDQVGEQVAHWITEGLQQMAIPVTPWDVARQSSEYVQAEADAGRVRDGVRALAEETGAGTVVSGSVYLVEGDSIELQLNVTDALRRSSLGSVEPVRGPRTSVSRLAADAQHRVMGFLAVRFDTLQSWAAGVIGEPPNFAAYREYAEGRRDQNSGRNREAIAHFRRAFELDSTWVQPLIRLSSLLAGPGTRTERDSLVGILEGFGSRMTPYDRAEVEAHIGSRDGDKERALAGWRRASELAPKSAATYNVAAMLTTNFNRPGEAVEVLRTFDPEREWIREMRLYWSVLFSALMMLEEHEQALDVARQARRLLPEPGVVWLRHQADALAALGRVPELHEMLDEIETQTTYPLQSFVEPIDVLHAYGHNDALREVGERVIASLEARPASESAHPVHRHFYGRALYLVGRLDEAQQVYDALVEETPGAWGRRATRAVIAASRGDTAQAQRDAEWFESLVPDEGQVGTTLYSRGLIAAALGDRERAVDLIRRSYDEGRRLYNWFHRVTLNVDPLRDYPPFQELMRPKG